MSVLSPVTMEKTPPAAASWHPYANIFPWLDGADRTALVEDIRKNGVIEPIVFLGGAVLDGRNRYIAARELGIEYPRCDYTGDDPLGFVISRNLARRHLSESQRAMVAGALANMTAGRPKENHPNLDGLNPDDPDQLFLIEENARRRAAAVSTKQAADMLNVGRASVASAKKVIRDGVPELAEAVKAGEVSVSAAAEIAKAPAAEQAAIVALPADQRVEVLKAKRAEAKAIRAALPTKSEAKRIAKETGGFVVDRTGSIQSNATDEDRKRTGLFLEVFSALRTLQGLTATPEQIVASVPAMSVESFDMILRDAAGITAAVLAHWEGRHVKAA